MFYSGMRPGEVYSLRWEQVDFEKGYLVVLRGKTANATRVIMLLPAIRDILSCRHRDQKKPLEGWVFPAGTKSGHIQQGSAKNQHQKAIRAVNNAAKEEAKKVGIDNPPPKLKPFAPYSLRHTALTNFGSQCDTFALKTIAGHSSIGTTQRYVHPQTQLIAQAFEKIWEQHRVVTDGSDSEIQEKNQAS